MDKVGLPWGPHRLLVLALAAGLSAFLAWRPGPLRVATAVTLGVLWCATHFTWEPLYDAHLGPDIARELTSLELQAYRVLSPVEALAPLIAVAVVAWNRTRHRGGGAGP